MTPGTYGTATVTVGIVRVLGIYVGVGFILGGTHLLRGRL